MSPSSSASFSETAPSSSEGPVKSTASTHGLANSSHSREVMIKDDELDQGHQTSLAEPEDISPRKSPLESPKLSQNGKVTPAARGSVLRGAVDLTQYSL